VCVCVCSFSIYSVFQQNFVPFTQHVLFVLQRFQSNVLLQPALFLHLLLTNFQLICVCNMFSRNINVTILIGLVMKVTIMYILDDGSGLFSLFRILDTIRTLTFPFCCKQSLQKTTLTLWPWSWTFTV